MARINLGKVVPQKGVDYFTDAEVAQIKAEMESDVNTRIGAAETRITTAEGNITSNTNAISALTTRVGTAEGNITTNSNNISALGGRVTTLETNMTTAQSNISTNTGDIATLNTQQTTQDTNIATNAADIDNLEEVVGIDTDTYDYDTTKTYEIGDFTVYNKKIYRCIQAVTTPGDFNANYWEEIYILNHFDTINDEQKAQDEKITQLETDKALLEDLIPTDNAEGETIDIDDSAKYYFKEFVPEGQTEQESTIGKNLLGLPENYTETPAIADVNVSIQNNEITISGTASGSASHKIDLLSNYTIQSGDYLHFGNDATNTSILFQFGNTNNGSFNSINKIVSLESLVGTTITNVVFFHNSSFSGTIHLKPMIIHNVSTATDYEPYSGGIPRTKSILSISY